MLFRSLSAHLVWVANVPHLLCAYHALEHRSSVCGAVPVVLKIVLSCRWACRCRLNRLRASSIVPASPMILSNNAALCSADMITPHTGHGFDLGNNTQSVQGGVCTLVICRKACAGVGQIACPWLNHFGPWNQFLSMTRSGASLPRDAVSAGFSVVGQYPH